MIQRDLYLAALIITGALAGCQKEKEPGKESDSDYYEIATPVKNQPTQEELIERGKYIVTVAGCNDCHSPKVMTERGPEPDPNRLMSGHNMNEPLPPKQKDAGQDGWIRFTIGLTSAVGPWGQSFAANLTPDETGIGAWTFENFKTAIRKGKYKGQEGGRDLLPPMPWQMYRHMTDEDLLSVFSYLKSLPKVNNVVPLPIPPQPEKISLNKK